MMSKKMKRFLLNATLMAGAALLMRTVSVSYNAYLTSEIGAEGMGLFALVISLQGFAITFATSGVQLAVTRLVSESLGKGEFAAARKAIVRGALYALFFSGIACIGLFFGAPFFGGVVLGDVRTILSLRILAFSLPPFALCAVLNGYFTAVARVGSSSVIMVVEQGLRILLTIWLIGKMAPYGMTYTCGAVVLGAGIAQLFSCLALLFRFFLDLHHLRGAGGEHSRVQRRLLRVALPVAFSSYIRAGLLTVEHILIPRSLVKGGRRTKEEALASYGILDGMAIPVAFYPMGILASFSGLLIPIFAAHKAREEEGRISYLANSALHYATLFAMGCTACLCAFSKDLGVALFDSVEAGKYICLLSATIPLMFLDHVTDCVLKGIGEQVWTMWVNIADSAISILLVILLLPPCGAMGYVYVIFLAEFFNFTLSFIRLNRVVSIRISLLRTFILPGLAAVVTIVLVRTLFSIDPMTATLPWVLGEVLFAATMYLVLVMCLSFLGKIKGRKRCIS